jgi:hypothetical protein
MKQILFALLVFVSFSMNAQTKATTAPTKAAVTNVPNPQAPSPARSVEAKPAVSNTLAPSAPTSPTAIPTPVAPVAEEKTNAKMTFESLNVDYGTIENGGEPLRTVKFTNTGTDPLVIKNARGSCGCTVPTFPKEPIAPGQSSVIEIRYDTKRTGKISKSVTITTNEGPDSHVLQVIGEVLPPKEDKAVPAAEPSIIKGQ